ncbi:ribonuclease HI [Deferrisoma camini]|uniref:ribonuclease HI n=1 Tax=Deferrisoma camini TaxID=1035120 RepID=UPI0004B2F3C3|nr:ribonuclease HI [Deferrisoma camini]
MADEQRIQIYTDGACLGNPGPGGWAAVLVEPGGRVWEIGGRDPATTNNRMELTAVIEGLRRTASGARVHVVTDSRYVYDGISSWIHGWKRRGWRKADGQPVLNRDLWEELDRLAWGSGRRVTWEHVRGHRGHAFNERCDELATAFARGETPDLRDGSGEWIGAAESGRSFPCYVSRVDGEVAFHGSWPECEARVRGVSGARHRKVRSPTELERVLREWEGA